MIDNVEQRTEEWHKKRTGYVSGSRAGAILGLSKWADRNSVMRDMVRAYFGAEREFNGNEATEHGNKYEPLAIQDYELETKHEVQSAGFITNPDIDWIGISPDGLVGDDGGVEIKCPYRGGIQTLEDKPDYLCQCYLSLIVTGRKWWDFYVKIIDNGREEVSHLERVTAEQANAWWEANKDTLKAFHDEYLEIIADKERAAEYLNDLEVSMDDNTDWKAAVELYLSAKQEADIAAEAVKIAKAKLQELAESTGAKKARGCGVQVYQSTRKGTVNYSNIPELNGVDLEQYRSKDSTYWTIK